MPSKHRQGRFQCRLWPVSRWLDEVASHPQSGEAGKILALRLAGNKAPAGARLSRDHRVRACSGRRRWRVAKEGSAVRNDAGSGGQKAEQDHHSELGDVERGRSIDHELGLSVQSPHG